MGSNYLMTVTVPIPTENRLVVIRKGERVEYELDRSYSTEEKNTRVKRRVIGKVDPVQPGRMFPNELYFELFPDNEVPEEIRDEFLRDCAIKRDMGVIRQNPEEIVDRVVKGLDEIGRGPSGTGQAGPSSRWAGFPRPQQPTGPLPARSDHKFNAPGPFPGIQIQHPLCDQSLCHGSTTNDLYALSKRPPGGSGSQNHIPTAIKRRNIRQILLCQNHYDRQSVLRNHAQPGWHQTATRPNLPQHFLNALRSSPEKRLTTTHHQIHVRKRQQLNPRPGSLKQSPHCLRNRDPSLH